MLLPIHRFVQYYEYNWVEPNAELLFSLPSVLSPGARGVLETKYLPLTPSVSRQRDEEGFQGLKRKALSCLDCCPFLPRKVVYRSLWLFVHRCLWWRVVYMKFFVWAKPAIGVQTASFAIQRCCSWLFTVLFFPIRSSGSSTCRYIRSSWFQMYWV